MHDGIQAAPTKKRKKKKIDTKKMSDTLIKLINREPVSEDEVEEVVQEAVPEGNETPQSRQGRKTVN
jgi:transcriptional regulator NrdR family protein